MSSHAPSSRSRRLNAALGLLVLGLSHPALAQTAPNAGQLLQELQPPLAAPRETVLPSFAVPEATPSASGGVRFTLREVRFTGSTLIPSSELTKILGDYAGKEIDLHGMRELASRIAAFYRTRGYPFARALLPPQDVADGVLTIQIVEGRYGKVTATGPDDLVVGATPFLARLRPGAPIVSDRLERASLILEDQPGIAIAPTIRPGAHFGEGDLSVAVRRDDRFGASISADNAGNRFTGNLRAAVSAYFNGALLFGDRLSGTALVTREGMWFGSADYELPIGGNGLRAEGGFAHTYYSLGKAFEALDAHGTASAWSGRASYPLIRSQRTNVIFSAGIQHKRLKDVFGAAGTAERKSSTSTPISVRFDHRDGFLGGAISYGAAAWTSGRLKLDSALDQLDAITARRAGRFNKITLDLARIQHVTQHISLYGRFSGQWADSNLDSSERLTIGGSDGVRSLAVGDAIGDQGWLGQVELRYAMGGFTPFAFIDAGHLRINAKPWEMTVDNDLSVSGVGVGLRYADARWRIEGSIARRLDGQASSYDGLGSSQIWISLSHQL